MDRYGDLDGFETQCKSEVKEEPKKGLSSTQLKNEQDEMKKSLEQQIIANSQQLSNNTLNMFNNDY